MITAPDVSSPLPGALGDMLPEAFRDAGRALIDWIASYLSTGSAPGACLPVLSRVAPGDIGAAFDPVPPEAPATMSEIIADFERILVPGLTHWNQPGFLAYFAISASGPGVLGELLTAALNQQAMLWRTSPAATELEQVVLGWLRTLLGLPAEFEGVITDGGSSSNLHALIAARAAAMPEVRTRGVRALPPLRVYCSSHAHSSIDKAMIVLGLGQDALYKVPVDGAFRMRPDVLAEAIARDTAAGVRPMAVVAAVGTTSTASIDPVPAIADVCARTGAWLHVDAAYAGPAAMLPDHAGVFAGVARADSVLVNPHKWLFTPIDLSALYLRRLGVLRAGLALTPDYLENREAGTANNLMDTGIALGRRFRALKLWMVLRYFGAAGIRARIAEHIRLAHQFAGWIAAAPDFELAAPASLSVVCFRAVPAHLGGDGAALDALNSAILDHVNATGEVFLSHTRLDGRFTLRIAIGHIRTAEPHVQRAWQLLQAAIAGAR
jgi:aromatic-L-amino-acid decarboxylase